MSLRSLRFFRPTAEMFLAVKQQESEEMSRYTLSGLLAAPLLLLASLCFANPAAAATPAASAETVAVLRDEDGAA